MGAITLRVTHPRKVTFELCYQAPNPEISRTGFFTNTFQAQGFETVLCISMPGTQAPTVAQDRATEIPQTINVTAKALNS